MVLQRLQYFRRDDRVGEACVCLFLLWPTDHRPSTIDILKEGQLILLIDGPLQSGRSTTREYLPWTLTRRACTIRISSCTSGKATMATMAKKQTLIVKSSWRMKRLRSPKKPCAVILENSFVSLYIAAHFRYIIRHEAHHLG